MKAWKSMIILSKFIVFDHSMCFPATPRMFWCASNSISLEMRINVNNHGEGSLILLHEFCASIVFPENFFSYHPFDSLNCWILFFTIDIGRQISITRNLSKIVIQGFSRYMHGHEFFCNSTPLLDSHHIMMARTLLWWPAHSAILYINTFNFFWSYHPFSFIILYETWYAFRFIHILHCI